jgi:hypothetical protein
MSSSEAQSAVKEWYEGNGGNMASSDDGLVFTYPNREMAEKVCSFTRLSTMQMLMIKVLTLGTATIPNLNGPIKAGWHSEAPKPESADVEMMEDQRRGDREEEE